MFSFPFGEKETEPAEVIDLNTHKRTDLALNLVLVLNLPKETGASFVETCVFYFPESLFPRPTDSQEKLIISGSSVTLAREDINNSNIYISQKTQSEISLPCKI